MIDFLSDFKDDTIEAIENILDEPIQSLAYIIPAVVSLAAIIGFFVAYIPFVVNGGYPEQMEILEGKKFETIFDLLTWGNIGVVLKGFLPIFEGILLIIDLLLVIISFFLEEDILKKILLTINLIVMGIVAEYFTFAALIDTGVISPNIEKNTAIFLGKLVGPMMIIGIISVITFFIQMLSSDCKEQFVYMLVAIGMSYLIIPLLLLALQNIIVLCIVAVVVLIIGIITLVLTMSSSGGGGTDIFDGFGNYRGHIK